MLHKARSAGLSAVALEAGGGVGGTWYFNRYPGARVDIQSMEYSFGFDEALQQAWHWTERYAAQPELLRYANHVADRFGLRDAIRLDTRVAGAAWDEKNKHWRVTSVSGEAWDARFLVMASGPLSSPNTPEFPGLAAFKGPVYHTARWPAETIDFSGKRVGLIGTGSSAVQTIATIGREAGELTVFQRTAAYAVPAHNGPLDPAFESRIKADYAGFRARNWKMQGGFGSELPPNPVSALIVDEAERERMFEARWRTGGFSFLGAFNDLLLDERANALAAEFVRGKIRAVVKNRQTASLLSPRQTVGCKRLCVDTGYYETYNRPNVKLVDVSREGIERITANGLMAGNKQHDFDALILATGFDAMTGTLMRLDLRGREGKSMKDKWRAGPLNYLGLLIEGFPNFFNVAGPGSTSAFTNVMVSIEHHINWIADCIAYLDSRGLQTIEAKPESETAWVEHVYAVAKKTVYLTCNSWYLGANIPGKPRVFMPLFGFPSYAARCTEVAERGYEGCVLG